MTSVAVSPCGDSIAINPYTFYTGHGSGDALLAIRDLFGIDLDYGAWGTMMTLHHVQRLEDGDRAVLLEMLEEGYASEKGYGV